MLRETELKLIDELLALKSGGGLFLEQAVARNPVENYASQRRFERERRLMQSLPRPLIHASELAEPGAFDDPGAAKQLTKRHDVAKSRAADLSREWEQLVEDLEQAEAAAG